MLLERGSEWVVLFMISPFPMGVAFRACRGRPRRHGLKTTVIFEAKPAHRQPQR
jgi:hypothetical protein